MKPNEPLVFGEIVRRSYSRTFIMVVQPKRPERDGFLGVFVSTESKNPVIASYIGTLGLFWRSDCEKVT